MDDEPDSRAAPGPVNLFHRYLGGRAAHLLAADAFLVLIAHAVLAHLWASAYEVGSLNRGEPAESFFVATLQLPTILQSLSTLTYYLAIFLLVWAVGRLLAGAVRGMMNEE